MAIDPEPVIPGTEPMSRYEHLCWAKRRALQYIAAGEMEEAWASLLSDLSKHPETEHHPLLRLGTGLLLAGVELEGMRDFIEGFH